MASTTCLTGCDSIITEFPWVEDFENGISCWDQYYMRGTVAWTTGWGGNAYGGISGAATGRYNARFTCNSYNSYTISCNKSKECYFCIYCKCYRMYFPICCLEWF